LGLSQGANFPHGLAIVLRLQSVSPFASRVSRNYSGSAAALDEEATKAAFSSPPHCRTVSHDWLIDSTYRPFGRSRASPVMSQDHFLQAAACITPVIHSWQFAQPMVGRVNGSRRRFMQGRWLAHHVGRNAVSRSRLAWPLRHIAFSGPSGGGALAAYLHR
jgi:hypothetical protein